ncbi:Cro/C1-type helix-turn-helix DNA-binding protein [Nonomuraea polychroma]|uniref:Cro/C1-type helix-turn-helix DNA-binding protein n=1 Tax=Nonomuraea polychroma TaxID=46176 RepID=A0A438M803_9ACTN|nr:Cro/C1-type helix-turn-helix DNA-binding protein [Nonomuraea polychroma]
MASAEPDAHAITVHLDRLLTERDLTLGQADRVGVTVANLSILKNGRAKAIRFTTLTKICGYSTASQVTCSAITARKNDKRTRALAHRTSHTVGVLIAAHVVVFSTARGWC